MIDKQKLYREPNENKEEGIKRFRMNNNDGENNVKVDIQNEKYPRHKKVARITSGDKYLNLPSEFSVHNEVKPLYFVVCHPTISWKILCGVVPYFRTLVTFCKKRWVGLTVAEVFSGEFPIRVKQNLLSIDKGRILVNNQKVQRDYILKEGDKIIHVGFVCFYIVIIYSAFPRTNGCFQ
jgi:hypothetical protein